MRFLATDVFDYYKPSPCPRRVALKAAEVEPQETDIPFLELLRKLGGMTPLEALRCGTLNGARSLGMDRDIGSLEPGKLADVTVIDGDPLKDIRVSEKVSWVMVNGRLYDAATLNETGAQEKKRTKYWWE